MVNPDDDSKPILDELFTAGGMVDGVMIDAQAPRDPEHGKAALEAALDLAIEAERDEQGNLTDRGKAQVQAALDQAR